MAYALSEELDQLVRSKLASGQYSNEEEVLKAALELRNEQEETIAAIAEGYEGIQAGRSRPFDLADAEFRQKHSISPDA